MHNRTFMHYHYNNREANEQAKFNSQMISSHLIEVRYGSSQLLKLCKEANLKSVPKEIVELKRKQLRLVRL